MAEPARKLITDRRLIRQLASLLERECKLYEEFLQLLKEQRKWLVKFSAEKFEELNTRRNEIHRKMQAAHAERLILMQQFPNSQGKKLTTLIKDHCTKADARTLLALAEKLRGLVLQSREDGRESASVLSFGLNVINGGISLIWQATQNVNRSYGRNAKVSESYSPRKSRLDSILKKA
jgi:hypothetical protein